MIKVLYALVRLLQLVLMYIYEYRDRAMTVDCGQANTRLSVSSEQARGK